MQQLISEANEYAKSIGQAGNLSINSFSDIVDAIDLVQQKQHIAGTTAREASTTIEGAFTMTKSAWENLVTAMGDPNADIGASIDALLESAGNLAQNLAPVVERALVSIGNVAATMIPQVLGKLPAAISGFLPKLLSATTQLFKGIVGALPGMAKGLVNAVPTILDSIKNSIGDVSSVASDLLEMVQTGISEGIPQIVSFLSSGFEQIGNFFRDNLANMWSSFGDIGVNLSKTLRASAPQLIQSGLDMLLKLAQGISNGLPVVIQKMPEIISNMAGIINDNAPKVLAMGGKIILTLASGIIKAIPALVANIPKILKAIWDVFMAFSWINLGGTIINAIKGGIVKAAPAVVNGAKNVGKNILNAFKGLPGKLGTLGGKIIRFLANGIKGAAGAVRSGASGIGKSIISALKALPSRLLALGKSAITSLASGIKAVVGTVKSVVSAIAKAIPSAFKSIPGKMKEIGSNLIKGLWNGIGNMAGWIESKIKGFGKGVLNSLKKFFGIHSPSKLMEKEVGHYIAMGVGVGIVKASGAVEKKAKEFASKTASAIVKGMTPQQVLAKKTVAIAQKALDDSKKKHKLTLKEEEDFWKKYLKKVKKGTDTYKLVLDKIAKVQAQEAKAKQKEQLDKILSSYIPTKTSAEKTVSIASKALKDFKSNHNLTLQEEENFWRRYRAKLKKNSEEYALVTNKIKKIRKQEVKEQKEAQKEKENNLVSTAESNLEKYKTYHDMSLKEEVDYWAKIVSQTTAGSDARYEADKKYLEAKKSLDEQVEQLSKDHADNIKAINDKLAEDIDAAWNEYNQQWESNYNEMLTKMSLLDHITLNQGIGMESLTQNLKEGNDATQEYLDLIDQIASNPIIPESLLDQIKSWGVENIATIKELANATPEALQAYVAEWQNREALASRYADTETAGLKEETKKKVEDLKNQATADIADIDKAYSDGLAKLGLSLNAKGEVVGAKTVDGIKTGVKSKSGELKATTTKVANGAVNSAEKNTNGRPIGTKIVNDTVDAIKAGRGTISSTISSLVSSAVSSAIGEAQASIQAQAAQVASSASSSSSATLSRGSVIADAIADAMKGAGTTIVNMTGTAYSPSQVMRAAKTEKRYAGI